MATLTDIRWHRSSNTLEITFDNNSTYTLPANFLRTNSPSAEVQGHGQATQIKPTDSTIDVVITGLEPVGHYAIKILFSDGHTSGLYRWEYLEALGQFCSP